MTKDLALLVGPEQAWMTTEQFFEAIRENLEAAMADGSRVDAPEAARYKMVGRGTGAMGFKGAWRAKST